MDDWKNRIHQGDAFQVLKGLPDESVHCIITSPPYYNQRDYTSDEQIGLEQTPEDYIDKLIEVFRESRRVLRHDGTLWINIGDSYNKNSGHSQERNNDAENIHKNNNYISSFAIKPKDLIGVPWMLAFALRHDGWWLRQDIIWKKLNCMPESVKNRCTKTHEYIFLLAKSQNYYYDYYAIKEPVSETSLKRAEYGWDCERPSTKNSSFNGDGIHVEKMGKRFVDESGRNKRSVWEVSTKSYKEAHFATFNTELITPCILAGTSSKGCCSKCGTPFNRIIIDAQTDWQQGCDCKDMTVVPCVVMDPFMGSGTTAEAATINMRDYVGIELNPEYVKLARKRMEGGNKGGFETSMFASI